MLVALTGLWLLTAHAAPGDPAPVDPPATGADPSTGAPESRPSPTPGPEPTRPSATPSRDPTCRSDPPNPDAPFAEELDRARRMYRLGCHGWALALLSSLDVRRRIEDVPPQLDLDTRLYLGELYFVLDRPDDARRTFEAVVLDHPDAVMGLLEHDPDVLDLFETVKSEVTRRQAARSTEPPSLPARPLWTWLPYGLGHLRGNDKLRFTLYGGGQLVCAGVAAATWVVHRRTWPGTVSVPQEIPRSLRLKAINYTASAGFIALYIASQVSATRRWKDDKRAELDMAVSPDGMGLTVRGRF